MEDTTPRNRELIRDIIMSKSVEERFLMCAEMFEVGKAMARVAMPSGLSKQQQEAYIFERLHGAPPEECVESEWLNIVYSGFWDYPFGIAVKFEGSVYFFARGGFDEEIDDYPSEYEVIRNNSVDMGSIRENFCIPEGGEVVGRVDMRQIRFDPSHRMQIHSRVFRELGIGK